MRTTNQHEESNPHGMTASIAPRSRCRHAHSTNSHKGRGVPMCENSREDTKPLYAADAVWNLELGFLHYYGFGHCQRMTTSWAEIGGDRLSPHKWVAVLAVRTNTHYVRNHQRRHPIYRYLFVTRLKKKWNASKLNVSPIFSPTPDENETCLL